MIFLTEMLGHKEMQLNLPGMTPTDNLLSECVADFIETVVPSCCVKVIRDVYPDPEYNYKGFIPAHGEEW